MKLSGPTRPNPRSRLLLGASPIEAFALWSVVAFSAAAVVGFATFGRNPSLLGRVPWSAPVYSISFTLFSAGQILVAASALALVLTVRVRARWLAAFAAIYLISLGSELAGTNVGLPFGPYRYGAALGPKWFGDVPAVIPLSWFMMAVPSYYFALRMAPAAGPLARAVLAAVILTLWDLALDPAMSRATAFWRWEVDGPYYGMPWINLAGWLVTSLAIMAALTASRADVWLRRLPPAWLLVFYATNVIVPLAMAAAAGLGWAVAVTLAAYCALGATAAVLRRAPAVEATPAP